MAFPSYTYTFTNGSTADATQVNQNFSDILNGISDTTKDISVNAATVAGTATLNGNVVIGANSTKTVTFNGSLASSIPLNAHNSYDIGSVTSLGLRAIYFASSSATHTAKLLGPAVSSDINITLPIRTSTLAIAQSPTITTETSGSGTYTVPANVSFLVIEMIGGGGGGGGSGVSGGLGGTGGNTTFSNFLTANGGVGGQFTAGAGGSTSVGAPATGYGITGGTGQGGGQSTAAGTEVHGGQGASTRFGGGGGGGIGSGGSGSTGGSAVANTGAGGGGGGANNAGTGQSGGGGGAGGYIYAIIPATLSATYSYAVGNGGSAGASGTTGSPGGTGGQGTIMITEFYF